MRPGMMPILHCPGVMMPGQFGPIRRTFSPDAFFSARNAFTRIMSLVGMPSVMQAITPTPRVCGLDDRVGGERRRHEDHRRVGAGLADGVRHRVEHRDALVRGAALARGDARHDLRAVVAAGERVERSLAAGQPCTRRRVSLPTQMLIARPRRPSSPHPRGPRPA